MSGCTPGKVCLPKRMMTKVTWECRQQIWTVLPPHQPPPKVWIEEDSSPFSLQVSISALSKPGKT